jgi:sugar/nucleoside kinase (ribokinase family)
MAAMDFLAVGDIVIDDFIRLKDAHVTCRIDNTNCEICMRWGDKIPFEFAVTVPAVGNSANAAVAAARLGLKSGLRAYVGADQHGQECIAALLRDKVDATFVEKQEGKHTNYHYVLWFESQRTILVKHEAYDYSVPPLSESPKWLYLSSLGENSLPYHHAWAEQLKRWPTTKLAFQPGTYQMKFGREELRDIYARTDIFFCNKEEAERILGEPAGSDIKDLLTKVQALGPKVVLITDDTRGAYCADNNGNRWHVPRYPDPNPPKEITGAGDAHASTTVAALALGVSLEEALLWGATNASAVLQDIGAQKGLLTREQLEHDLKNPPAPFALEKI